MSKQANKAFDRPAKETAPENSVERLAVGLDEEMKRLLFNLSSFSKRSTQTLNRLNQEKDQLKEEIFEMTEDVDSFLKESSVPFSQTDFSLSESIKKALVYLIQNWYLKPEDQISVCNAVITSL